MCYWHLGPAINVYLLWNLRKQEEPGLGPWVFCGIGWYVGVLEWGLGYFLRVVLVAAYEPKSGEFNAHF